jgi:hypothetical protein
MSREQRSKILLAIVLVVFAGVMINQFVLSDDSSSGSSDSSTARQQPKNSESRRSRIEDRGSRPQPQVRTVRHPQSEQGYRPLPLHVLGNRRILSADSERNVFVYYVPPPPPPKIGPPPPPPPLTITGVSPISVFAKTKDFTLKVFGVDLPLDALVFAGSWPLPTTRVSATELNAKVEKRLIAAPGGLQVVVKNQGGTLFSNPLAVTIQEPPEPTYRYIGRIDNLVYLQKETDERLIALLGQTVENRWRVAAVTSDNVVLEDVVLDIPYTVPMEDRTPGAGMAGIQPGVEYPGQMPRTVDTRRRGQKINPQGTFQPQLEPEPTPVEEEP